MGDPGGSSKVFVVGASLGGVDALQRLAAQLPATFPAPVIIVLHIGQHQGRLPELLARRGPLPATYARDGETLAAGRIYVAPPDHHLLLEGAVLRLSKGPKENHARPAIDPLFRSAALSRGPDVVGVVLTGLLDDGTAGLQAVKHCGGTAVVQDPADAHAPSMPRSAMRFMDVDHCVPLSALGPLLCRLAGERSAEPSQPRREAIGHEHAVFMSQGKAMEHLDAIGRASSFACPECNGTLWEIADVAAPRYRCHTGHAFTLRTLEQALSETLENSLWSTIRALQEKSAVLEKIADDLGRARPDLAQQLARHAKALAEQAESLRKLHARLPGSEEAGGGTTG